MFINSGKSYILQVSHIYTTPVNELHTKLYGAQQNTWKQVMIMNMEHHFHLHC